jgi:DNA-binding transcriptional LysR family regulator
MDLRLFKTLIAVAKAESITKATEEVFLTQPAITKQIKALEELYGVILFERRGRKFVLTEDGRVLLDYADRIVNLYKESLDTISEMDGKLRGTLKMGANLTLGIYVLPKLFKRFYEAYPDIKIEVSLDNSDNIIKAVKRNDVSFGFIGLRFDDPLVVNHLFYQEQIKLVIGPNMKMDKKAMRWKEIESFPYICREKGSDIRETCEKWLAPKNIKLKPQIVLNNTEAIKTCVQNGLGFSLLPWCSIEQEVKAGLIREVSVPYFGGLQDHYVSHYRGKKFSTLEKTFLEFLFDEIETKGS